MQALSRELIGPRRRTTDRTSPAHQQRRATAQTFAESLGGRKPGDGARPRRSSSGSAATTSATVDLEIPADDVRGTQTEQTLAEQQAASASSVQQASPVATSPADAIPCDSAAAFSPPGTWAKPDAEKTITRSRTIQHFRPRLTSLGAFPRCHVLACTMRIIAFRDGLEAVSHTGLLRSLCIDLNQGSDPLP